MPNTRFRSLIDLIRRAIGKRMDNRTAQMYRGILDAVGIREF